MRRCHMVIKCGPIGIKLVKKHLIWPLRVGGDVKLMAIRLLAQRSARILQHKW